jgi:DNA-binding MarR family transcriptional regulator
LTKQAIGLLADELEKMGYIRRHVDEKDGRARILVLTDAGQRLMLDTLEIIEEIEERFISLLGSDTLTGLRTGLAAFIGIRQSS